MSGPSTPKSLNLAQRRQLQFRGKQIRGPLVVPSFSSRAIPPRKVADLVRSHQSRITRAMLVSALDVADGQFEGVDLFFPTILFVDSGGYEKHRDVIEGRGDDRKWTADAFRLTVARIGQAAAAKGAAVVATSYDVPGRNGTTREQIARAQELLPSADVVVRELLLKPEPGDALLQIEKVAPYVRDIGEFGILGVTEKELGTSLFERLCSLARLRQLLKTSKVEIPIHVFGCMDPTCTPLYFMCGGDIFDGLAWLRYRFLDGVPTYIPAAALREEGMRDGNVQESAWARNLGSLERLEEDMVQFLQRGVDVFGEQRAKLIQRTHDFVTAELGE